MVENVEFGEPVLGYEQRLAQVAAERHPEAYAAELPENWAGHEVDLPFELGDRVRRAWR